METRPFAANYPITQRSRAHLTNDVAGPTPAPSKSAGRSAVAPWLSHWREDFFIGFALFLLYLLLGAYISVGRGYLPGDAMARLASAYLVLHGIETKLSSIGFVWPPIPTLLVVPLTLFQPLVDSWLAVVVVSAAFMAAAAVTVGQIATLAGVGNGWRRLLTLLFATNPLMLAFGINGMSEAILIAVATAGFYWLIRFSLTDSNWNLIVASALFGLLPLIRYEMALLTVGAAVLFALPVSRLASDQEDEEVDAVAAEEREKRKRSTLQGRLIAYFTLAGYPTVLWALASWQIMGSPIYFLVNDRSALSVSQIDLGGQRLKLPAALQLAFYLWISAYPATVAASLVAGAIAVARRSPFLFGLATMPFAIPLFQGLLLSRGSTVPLVRYYIMVVPLTYMVALAAYHRLLSAKPRTPMEALSADPPGQEDDPTRKARLFLAVAAVFLLGSSFASGVVLTQGKYQDFEHETWISLTTNEKVKDRRIPETMGVGRVLAGIVPRGGTVLVDEYQYGYAAILGSRDPRMFVNHTHPDYDRALNEPWNYVDFLLVPSPEGRGALYSINRYQPGLYTQGAPWAELVDELPRTEVGWRLYRVAKRDYSPPPQPPE